MTSPYKFETALDIIADAAVQLSLPRPVAAYGSSDLNALLLGSLLNNAGNVLTDMEPWQQLRGDLEFVGDGVTAIYPLPENFNRVVDNTGWSNAMSRPVAVVTDRSWSMGKMWMSNGMTITPVARIVENSMQFFNPLADGEIVTFQYTKNNWVIDSINADTYKYKVTADTDVPQFDWLLMVYCIKKLWLDAKGMDAAAAANEMNFRLNQLVSRNTMGQLLSLNGSGIGGVNPLLTGGCNLPLTGYGA